MTVESANSGRLRNGLGEVLKLPAFVRRDFVQATSYPMGFVADAAGLVSQTIVLYYVSQLVDPSSLPTYGGQSVSYIEFVVVGIAISTFIGLGLFRAAAAFRREQLMGTLESVLMTPTATTTVQLGSVVYDLLYVPLRTLIFFALVAVTLDLGLDASGVVPAATVLALFVPFVWGLGIGYAAANLTFRVGGGAGLVGLLTITSGAYFPITLFPAWLQWFAERNPMTVAIDAMRECMLGGERWEPVLDAIPVLVPAAVVSLVLGLTLFRHAMRRERRRGTVGLY